MTKFDLSQTITVLANLGVIAGIVFLAIELRQNNEFLAAQERFNRVTLVAQQFRTVAEDSNLTELRVRAARGEPLTDVEQRRIDGLMMSVFVILQWEFEALPSGSPEIANMREVQRQNFARDASYRSAWQARKAAFSPGFVQWMEANVVGAQ
jgi:hypothetical protein